MELNLNTVQKLALSQHMVLSAKILQMSSIELNAYLKELSETNPLIEYEEPPQPEKPENDLTDKLEWLYAGDEQNQYYYNQDSDEESENWNFSSSQGETLEKYLLSQINTQHLKPNVKMGAEFAARSLDKSGYLIESAESIAAFTGITEAEASEAVAFLKTLEPAGVGASCLSECLEIQLLAEVPHDETALNIVRNYLDFLAKNQLKTISKRLGVSLEEVITAGKKIKSLNPKPSRGFPSNESLGYISPDAYVYKTQQGHYEITLNDYYSPSIRINNYYKSIIKSGENNDVKEYINDKLSQAQWIVKCIDRRNSTLMSTLQFIVTKQLAFFEKGEGNLVPLKLSDVAENLNIHESTASRAVRDKYIQCSWGIFPISYFFSLSVPKSSQSSLEVSRDSVNRRIKEIIDGENKQKPLSDRAIAEILSSEGISVSRRTVAKYRELMGIGGTSVRKDF